MKRGVTTLLSVAGSLVLATGAHAITSENPYQAILDRNVFGLKPPPPPVDPTAEAAKPPPNVFLTGITTLLGTKRALIKTTPPPGGKPGEKGVEEHYMLTEGQRDGDVEVLQIDELKGIVRIRLAGKEMPLDFDNNGVKITAAPVAAPPPGGPTPGALPGFPFRPAAGTTSPLPPPGATPLGASSGTYNSSASYNPAGATRNVRLGASPAIAGGTTSSFNEGIPSAFSGSLGNRSINHTQSADTGLSPEERAALIELNKQKAQMAGDPMANLFPPSGISPTPSMPIQGGQNSTPQPLLPRAPGLPPFPQ